MDGETASPMANKTKTKTPMHTLIRVRNNQRQHRQRRRDYIESLERRLKATEDIARQLEIENEALRKHLSSESHQQQKSIPPTATAVSDINLSTYYASMDTINYLEMSRAAASNSAARLQPGPTLLQVQTEFIDGTGIQEKPTHPIPPSVSNTLFPDAMGSLSYVVRPSEMQKPIGCCSEPSYNLGFFDNGTDWPDIHSLRPLISPEISISATTLCAQAYLVIQHQNRRGLSSKAIESWLWPGFIYNDESADSGCRVDSRLLLGLLVYIAEDSGVETRTLEELSPRV